MLVLVQALAHEVGRSSAGSRMLRAALPRRSVFHLIYDPTSDGGDVSHVVPIKTITDTPASISSVDAPVSGPNRALDYLVNEGKQGAGSLPRCK